MSAIDKALPKLTEDQLAQARALQSKIEALQAELQEMLRKAETPGPGIDLRERGIGEDHADELRARLRAFAEDWNRPEASIYDEDPAR